MCWLVTTIAYILLFVGGGGVVVFCLLYAIGIIVHDCWMSKRVFSDLSKWQEVGWGKLKAENITDMYGRSVCELYLGIHRLLMRPTTKAYIYNGNGRKKDVVVFAR